MDEQRRVSYNSQPVGARRCASGIERMTEGEKQYGQDIITVS